METEEDTKKVTHFGRWDNLRAEYISAYLRSILVRARDTRTLLLRILNDHIPA